MNLACSLLPVECEPLLRNVCNHLGGRGLQIKKAIARKEVIFEQDRYNIQIAISFEGWVNKDQVIRVYRFGLNQLEGILNLHFASR